MLVQTDRFGTSVAQALRTHADVSRTKRRQRAEERAAKIGVKLVFPLVFCLFPAFYVVTLGPAIIKFVEAFSPEAHSQEVSDEYRSITGVLAVVFLVLYLMRRRSRLNRATTRSRRTLVRRLEGGAAFDTDFRGFVSCGYSCACA